jgi:hypothetical protein
MFRYRLSPETFGYTIVDLCVRSATLYLKRISIRRMSGCLIEQNVEVY